MIADRAITIQVKFLDHPRSIAKRQRILHEQKRQFVDRDAARVVLVYYTEEKLGFIIVCGILLQGSHRQFALVFVEHFGMNHRACATY